MGTKKGGGLREVKEEEKTTRVRAFPLGAVRRFKARRPATRMPAKYPHHGSGAEGLLPTSHRPKLDQTFALSPPPLQAPVPGSSTEADSQIKIARGTIQTLLTFCEGLQGLEKG